MRRIFFGLFCLSVFSLFSCSRIVRVGVLSATDSTDSQTAALQDLVSQAAGMECTGLTVGTECDFSGYDLIWYHRPDSSELSENEVALGPELLDYVRKGGHLVLSDDAVRLLNAWGLESTPVQVFDYFAEDEGFGRKVGYHAFRSHPLFDGLHGGAYVWHGHEDNMCRVLGFPEGSSPSAPGARVLGIFWEYIFYHPEEKVVWETPCGKGSILAVGGLLNYGEANYNRSILERFTLNCVNYLTGRLKSEDRDLSWDYSNPKEVREAAFESRPIRYPSPEAWETGDDVHALDWEASSAEVNIATRRSMVVCKEKGGIFEIWTHPFMSLRDYRAWIVKNGDFTLLEETGAGIELRSNSIIRTFSLGEGEVREIITSPVDEPYVVVHYEWTENVADEIIVDFKSNLRYMWPYAEDALGSLEYGWDAGMNAFVCSDSGREFVSMVGSNVPASLLSAGRFSTFEYESGQPCGIPEDLLQVAASVSLDIKGQTCCDVILSAGSEGLDKVRRAYRTAIASPFAAFSSSRKYYEDYCASHFHIESPDSVFNEGCYWATVSSDQFNVDVPGMGRGLFAGYSSSRRGWGGGQRVSGRPGYAWFFGRDSEWSGLALLEMGDTEAVKDILKMLIRYQRIDGKIYHEATSSGSIHYDSSDGTPFFVVLMGRYLEASGDLDFIRENIGAVHKALAFCQSTDTNGDGLLENTNVGHGWLEGGEFYGSITELVIAALYCRGLYYASQMCSLIGDRSNAEEYLSRADRTKNIINTEYWNPEKEFYNFGKMPDGSFTTELLSIISSSIYLGDTDYDKSRITTCHLGDIRMSGDWGVRTIADSCVLNSSGAYTEDNCWPLFTGTVALDEYAYGRYNQGFEHIMQNLLAFAGETHGRIPEVFSGYSYRSCGITPNQCWSETMTIQPVIEGMLGFRPYAVEGRIALSPRIPLMWDSLKVCNLKSGRTTLDLEMERTPGNIVYKLFSDNSVVVDMKPSFGPGTEIRQVGINGESVDFEIIPEEEYTTVGFSLKVDGKARIEISVAEKPSVLPHYLLPSKNDLPSGCRISSQKFSDGSLHVTLQGRGGTSDRILVRSTEGPIAAAGADSAEPVDEYVYGVDVSFPGARGEYVTKEITINTVE